MANVGVCLEIEYIISLIKKLSIYKKVYDPSYYLKFTKKKGLLLHKYMNFFYLVYEVQNDQV